MKKIFLLLCSLIYLMSVQSSPQSLANDSMVILGGAVGGAYAGMKLQRWARDAPPTAPDRKSVV